MKLSKMNVLGILLEIQYGVAVSRHKMSDGAVVDKLTYCMIEYVRLLGVSEMLICSILNTALTTLLFGFMMRKYIRDRQEAAFGWAVMFAVMIAWNISLYIKQSNLLSEKPAEFIIMIASCYLGLSTLFATLKMVYGELSKRAISWLLAGVILSLGYSWVATEFVKSYAWILLPALLIISGSELTCAVILLKFFRWEGKSKKINAGVICIIISLFVLTVNTFIYAAGIYLGDVHYIVSALIVSVVAKVFFFAGIVMALL